MAGYSHLRKLDVTQDSEAEFIFTDIIVARNADGTVVHPSLWCRPMTEANRVYQTERVRMATTRAEESAKTKAKDKVEQLLDRLVEDRDWDRVMVAKTCAIKWGTPPLDEEGKSHDFTPDDCLAFLQALPDFMFEPLRSWVQNPYNFIDREAYETGGGVVDPVPLGNS